MEQELERTFLVKVLPPNLKECQSEEIFDIYLPKAAQNAKLRIRKKGEKLMITKKVPNNGDPSNQTEHTIPLSEEEFKALLEVDGRKLRKIRYLYPADGRMSEIDVFLDDLEGLVVADFEFETVEDKDNFTPPDFCLEDVTEDMIIAGGFLAGKKYSEIQEGLNKYGYNKLALPENND